MTAGEQLQHYLNRFFDLRQHGDDTVFLSRLRRLQDWQSQRLSHTTAIFWTTRPRQRGSAFCSTKSTVAGSCYRWPGKSGAPCPRP